MGKKSSSDLETPVESVVPQHFVNEILNRSRSCSSFSRRVIPKTDPTARGVDTGGVVGDDGNVEAVVDCDVVTVEAVEAVVDHGDIVVVVVDG